MGGGITYIHSDKSLFTYYIIVEIRTNYLFLFFQQLLRGRSGVVRPMCLSLPLSLLYPQLEGEVGRRPLGPGVLPEAGAAPWRELSVFSFPVYSFVFSTVFL